ncbi:glycoside hydrolase family 88 protein [uncultured Draconibacterium sp.]|uniref:glycoside hydrolase family 88/105 protein n=1 Tax=uncultured Draconibacterium sp. TaxID=1573823 RepID=UPI00321670AD
MKTISLKLLVFCAIVLFTANSVNAADFNPDTLYSRWIINSRMGDFRNKTATTHFKTETSERNIEWDYVPGLVAKAIIMTWEHYQDQPWSKSYYSAVEDYADNIKMRFGESDIDDLNAGKIFFELYRGAKAKGQNEKAETYKKNATTCRNKLINEQIRIAAPLPGAGGFWHKKKYVNQMWLDGLYMGPALYAEWQGNFGMEEGTQANNKAWDDIVMQFDTIFAYTWDAQKKLNYHAWSAEPLNAASSFWADPKTGRSQEFWGRGMGWFFGALVDVLENMPKDHPARPRLVQYVNKVADGLKDRQDEKSGCWYQLLQYDNSKTSSCGINNYLESSASAMFTYAYLKGIRLGILDSKIYMPVATKAYKGLINNFVVEEADGKIKLIQSCESAGLSDTRKGDADYYLCGGDVTINNNTEGKVLGPFIMASLEFEKAK